MTWSRHDLFFRRNALAASRLTHNTKPIGFGLLALAGMSVTTAGIAVATVGQAQNFTPVGPRYAGEVILSERIVSPAPERLPAPKPATSRSSSRSLRQPTLSVAGEEPVSLSDSAKRSALSLADQTPIFALGNDVWKRMLELERENADLQAQLEYERKLASYIERSEIHLMNQNEKIVELQEKLKQLQQEGVAKGKEQEKAQAQIRQLTGRNRDFEQKVRDLQSDLRLATKSQIALPEKEKQDFPSEELPARKVATKPVSPRSANQRPAKQRQPTSELPEEKAAQKQQPAELPVPARLSVPAALPSPIAMPEPVDMPAPESAKPDAKKKPTEKKVTEKKVTEKKVTEQPKSDKPKKPTKRGKPEDKSRVMLESDEEPVGSVALAVIPIGFEIPDGLVKPIKETQSEVKEAETAPIADEGLQGGALGPLGKKEPLEE